ncbi:MAG: thymidine phosphorylase [bacterium]|nr:thymidine phosphorylase [bacterium]
MNALDIIEAKKRGRELAAADIDGLIAGFTSGAVPEYQMAAFLMATWFRGMTPQETADLTGAMLRSGEQLDTARLSGPTADKHSTGGVGDKVSLLLAPLAAACGLKVPMLSGRGLGHTGGTLDKLEAIPGYDIRLGNTQFLDIVEKVGCAIIGQGPTIAPADGRIYALRDVTGTVDCVPLITASIMSKKLAAGPATIVIDLKTGSGAFMRDLEQARELATALVAVGRSYGRKMAVVFSDMDQPLGVAIGHANETLEAFAALRPAGRQAAPADLVMLTEELTADMVRVAGVEATPEAAMARVRAAWDSGRALAVLLDWVVAQGGRLEPGRDDFGLDCAPAATELLAPHDGWLSAVDCRQMGLALADLGAARRRVEDKLDLSAGMDYLVRVGEAVTRGQPLVRVSCQDRAKAETAVARLGAAITVGREPAAARPLILGRLE